MRTWFFRVAQMPLDSGVGKNRAAISKSKAAEIPATRDRSENVQLVEQDPLSSQTTWF
jgi:hypothetical protein